MRNVRRMSLLLAILLVPPPSATGGARMDLQVSPRVSLEPAYVTIRVRLESNPDNRSLEVVADSPDFRRSSQISLDGERAPRLNTFEFRGLPMGVYEVSSTLVGQTGAATRIARTLLVESHLADRQR